MGHWRESFSGNIGGGSYVVWCVGVFRSVVLVDWVENGWLWALNGLKMGLGVDAGGDGGGVWFYSCFVELC